MSSADALALVSSFEPYGAVVAEALQWGTPCLVRDTCGCRELITAENGVVYHDAEDFAAGVEATFALKRRTGSLLGIDLRAAIEDLAKGFHE